MKTPHGTIIRNRNFAGLSIQEAMKISNYFHFRQPERLNDKSPLEKADLDKAIDFLDPLDEDIPSCSWSLQLERGSGLVILRSLLWQGLTFYHIPETTKHGYIYCGSGEMNKDLPFML